MVDMFLRIEYLDFQWGMFGNNCNTARIESSFWCYNAFKYYAFLSCNRVNLFSKIISLAKSYVRLSQSYEFSLIAVYLS
jgi:hypothetical protein